MKARPWSRGERDRLRRNAADPNHVGVFLRNHGLLTLGLSIADAFCWMYYLDRACQVQIDCLQTGKDLATPSEAVCQRTADIMRGATTRNGA